MPRFLRVILPAILAAAAGCGSRGPSTATSDATSSISSKPARELAADEILKRLLDNYRNARSYADNGVVRLQYLQKGRLVAQEWKSSVQFERPSKLALDAFQAVIRCDGVEFRARIEDPLTDNVDNQVLVHPAPKVLALQDLATDALLYDILASHLRRQPIQIELLLESRGLAAAFGNGIACRRLEDGNQEGQDCFRVEVPSPGGAFVFWVDQERFLLRRLDYPAAALVPELASDPAVSELKLSAELHGAEFDPTIEPETFTLEIPASAKRMRSFVVPLRPLPTNLFGQQPADFVFGTPEGGKVTRDDLAGKVTLLVWYRNHEACKATLAEVAKVLRQFADDQRVAIYAVNTDSVKISSDELTDVLKDWGADLPLLRDREAFGRSVFDIEAQPTIVVLDAQGRLQIFQTGGNPELAAQLSSIIGRLVRGEDIAAEVVRRAQSERAEYDRMVASGGPQPQPVVELPEVVIKAHCEPAKLKLRKLWGFSALTSPGNVYVLTEAIGSRIVVCDGGRAVAELNGQGKLLARQELDLPPGAAVTYLRSARDSLGKQWIVGCAPLSTQLFVFDDKWKTRLTYPDGPSPAPVCDVQLADLQGDDGLALYIGFVGEAGLHAVSMERKLLWKNKTFANVVSIAVAPPIDDLNKPKLLLTGEDGTILGVNRYGNEEPRKPVGKRPIVRIAAARFTGAAQAAFLGIAGDERGNSFAVGINAGLEEQWSYPLPPGVHQTPIEAVTSGDILPDSAGAWILAAPDGSIHVVSDDGDFTDLWYYGSAVTGVAVTRIEGQAAIIVATPREVAAWSVTK